VLRSRAGTGAGGSASGCGAPGATGGSHGVRGGDDGSIATPVCQRWLSPG
jgi:hypothetical protein